MTTLVTGAFGCIGSWVVRTLLESLPQSGEPAGALGLGRGALPRGRLRAGVCLFFGALSRHAATSSMFCVASFMIVS